MTRYKFSQQVRIGNDVFKVGIQQVSEETELHKDFLHFVKCGWIHEAPPEQVAAQPAAVNESAQRLADRIKQKLEAKKPKAEPEKEPAAEPKKDEESEPVHEGVQDDEQKELTPAEKAKRTREAKKKNQEA